MSWNRYVSASERRKKGARKAAQLKKSGRDLHPVQTSARKIATTFWGRAWCDNLESYSDYANRLPRGRTYVRNGSVIDLKIDGQTIEAVVVGSRIYNVRITIDPLPTHRWNGIRDRCVGQIDSVVELLGGRLSDSVMDIVSRPQQGLFPSPREIHFRCSCPDWASMCKHVAATLYGVGLRLDDSPELLFGLRSVDPEELVTSAIEGGALSNAAPTGRVLDGDLSEIFGIDFDDDPLDPAPPALSDRASAVLALIEAKPGQRKSHLTVLAGLSNAQLTAAITELRKQGLVEFRGAKRNGGYFASP